MNGTTSSPDAQDLTGPLAGREQEQRELLAILDRCLSGHGGVALISGEAGIGKTTLCDRLTVQARNAGALTVTGHCYNLTVGQPYGPWIEIQRTLVTHAPEARLPSLTQLSENVAGPESREELFAQFSAKLREITSRQPLVLIIEDLHWADHASLELLRNIARQAASLSILVVATFRDDEPDSGNRLPAMLPELVRESRASRLELRRLSLEDVREIVNRERDVDESARASIADYLHQRGEGNPFFMVELLRDLIRDGSGPRLTAADASTLHGLPVPALVRQVIDNRIDQMSEPTRALLSSAAVIGQDVAVDLWQVVSEASDRELADGIEEAVNAHLLYESADGANVRFVHGLIQETLYRGQVALRRRRLHRAIADHLARQPGASPDVVAHHLELANDGRVVEWLVRAAGRARQVYAAPDAIRYVARAMERAEYFSIPLPLEAYRIRALAHEMLGETELAKLDFASLLQAAREAGDRPAECQGLIDLGLLWAGQDYARSGEYLQAALRIARDLDDRRVRAQCLNRMGNWYANTGQFEPAIEMHQEALEIFESAADADGIADTLDLLGSTNYLAGNNRASAEYFDRSIQRSRELNDRVRLASSLANLAILGGELDVSFDGSVAASRSAETWVNYAEEAVQISQEIGWKSGESFALAMLGAVVAVRGDLGRALQALEHAQEIAHRFGHQQWLTGSALILGGIWSELLDPSRAHMQFERGRGLAQGLGSHLWSSLLDTSLATFHADNGDLASAIALLEPWQSVDGARRSHAWRCMQFAAGRVRLAAWEPGSALKIAEELICLEGGGFEPGGIPQVLKLKANALTMLDRIEEAADVLAHAALSAELLEYRAIHWHVLRDWSVVESRLGHPHRAAELRTAAGSIVHEIARTIRDPEIRNRFHTRAYEMISAADVGRDRARGNSAGLSQRELEVLSLVAEGLTVAQVGEQLFISPRTVARHLQSIYTKIGVNSRAGATAYAYKHELIS